MVCFKTKSKSSVQIGLFHMVCFKTWSKSKIKQHQNIQSIPKHSHNSLTQLIQSHYTSTVSKYRGLENHAITSLNQNTETLQAIHT